MPDDPRWLLHRPRPWFNPVTEGNFAEHPERVIAFNRLVPAPERPDWAPS
jgi:hypothetical protein